MNPTPSPAPELNGINWPDEQDYMGVCSQCKKTFRGVKGRIRAGICFSCFAPQPSDSPAPEAPELLPKKVSIDLYTGTNVAVLVYDPKDGNDVLRGIYEYDWTDDADRRAMVADINAILSKDPTENTRATAPAPGVIHKLQHDEPPWFGRMPTDEELEEELAPAPASGWMEAAAFEYFPQNGIATENLRKDLIATIARHAPDVAKLEERIDWLEGQREIECREKEAALRESETCLRELAEVRDAWNSAESHIMDALGIERGLYRAVMNNERLCQEIRGKLSANAKLEAEVESLKRRWNLLDIQHSEKCAEVTELKAQLDMASRVRPTRGDVKTLEKKLEASEAENARLREALQWYGTQAEGCRKLGSIGEAFRVALDQDGGLRANIALAAPPAPSAWREMASIPKTEDEPFLVLCPGNGVCDWLVLQVANFQGDMYPDHLDGNVDYGDRVLSAIGWMPVALPEPPAREEKISK